MSLQYSEIGGPSLCYYCNRVTKKGLKTATHSVYICAKCMQEHGIEETISSLLHDQWTPQRIMDILGFPAIQQRDKGGNKSGRSNKGVGRK